MILWMGPPYYIFHGPIRIFLYRFSLYHLPNSTESNFSGNARPALHCWIWKFVTADDILELMERHWDGNNILQNMLSIKFSRLIDLTLIYNANASLMKSFFDVDWFLPKKRPVTRTLKEVIKIARRSAIYLMILLRIDTDRAKGFK